MTTDEQTELLIDTITKLFAGRGPDEVAARAANFTATETEMFRVESLAGNRAQLAEVFYDEMYSPVILPEELIGLVEVGDEFMMTIGRRFQSWQVLWMSTPYFEGGGDDGDDVEETDGEELPPMMPEPNYRHSLIN